MDQRVDQREIVRRDHALAMLRGEALGDHIGIAAFIEAVLVKPDRAGAHRPARGLRHQRDHRRAIDPARQERAQRHIRHHARRHRIAQQRDQLFLKRLGRPRRTSGEVHIPPARRRGHRFAALDQQAVPGGQLLHARDETGVVGHIAKRQIILDRAKIGRAPQQRMREQPLQFRRESDPAIGQLDVMQRLHAEPVAREKQALPPRIVQREGEHAVQPIEQRRAPGRPAVEQHLGIARRHEHGTPCLQLRAQGREIIDLAIIGDGQRAISARHWLRRSGDINDRQPSMPQPHPRRGPHTRSVGPAMRLRIRHRRDPRGIDGLWRRGIIETSNPAHQLIIPALRSASRSIGPSAATNAAIAKRGSWPGTASAETCTATARCGPPSILAFSVSSFTTGPL
ncbi:hypothetical protein D9M73_107700 [compost metagenome]